MAVSKSEDAPLRAQAEKFADLARELECDEDQEAFDERLKRVAQPKAPIAPKEQ